MINWAVLSCCDVFNFYNQHSSKQDTHTYLQRLPASSFHDSQDLINRQAQRNRNGLHQQTVRFHKHLKPPQHPHWGAQVLLFAPCWRVIPGKRGQHQSWLPDSWKWNRSRCTIQKLESDSREERTASELAPWLLEVKHKQAHDSERRELSRPISGSDELCDRAVSWLTVESTYISCAIPYSAHITAYREHVSPPRGVSGAV